MRRWLHLLAAACMLASPLTFAAEDGAPVSWSSLSAAQQQTLGSFADKWAQLPPARQQALARGAQRWAQMSPSSRTARAAASNPGIPYRRSDAHRSANNMSSFARCRLSSRLRCARISAASGSWHLSSVRRCASAGTRQRPSSVGGCCSRRVSVANAYGLKGIQAAAVQGVAADSARIANCDESAQPLECRRKS